MKKTILTIFAILLVTSFFPVNYVFSSEKNVRSSEVLNVCGSTNGPDLSDDNPGYH